MGQSPPISGHQVMAVYGLYDPHMMGLKCCARCIPTCPSLSPASPVPHNDVINAFPLPEQDLGPHRVAIFTAEESRIAHDHQLMPLAHVSSGSRHNHCFMWDVSLTAPHKLGLGQDLIAV
jgi:hypothetical protein